MWMPSFWYVSEAKLLLITLGLVLVNAVLCSYVFSRIGITNLPSSFVAGSYFLFMSSVPQLATCWQGQMCITGIFAIILLLTHTGRFQELVEESFLSTVIICLLCFVYPMAVVLIPLVWIFLILRRSMTLRVLLASLLGILLVAIYTLIIGYIGWVDFSWPTILTYISDYMTAVAVGLFCFVLLIAYWPVKRESMTAGIFYFVSVHLALVWGILSHIHYFN